MACGTLIYSMAFSQWKKIMIDPRAGPGIGIIPVTLKTLRTESGLLVFRIGRGIIISLVAGDALRTHGFKTEICVGDMARRTIRTTVRT